MKRVKLIIFDTKINRYSFNALLGALETKPELLENIEVSFVKTEKELLLNIDLRNRESCKLVFCFSFFTTQIWDVSFLLDKTMPILKDKGFILAGGPHPTGDIKGTLKMGFDFVVRGEGEEIFLEFLEKLILDKDPLNIDGLAFLNGDRVFFKARGNIVDLDRYPPFSLRFNRIGPIEITRGCPFGCYFCQTPRIFGTRVRHRSIDKIAEAVENLIKRGIGDIRFITPNAFSYGSLDGKTINLEKLEELLKTIRSLIGTSGRIFFGTFPSEVRPEHVTAETLELIKKYTNNDNLIIGAQSGSDRVLELCNRGHSVSDVYRAVDLSLKAGLRPKVDFIFGLPGEREKDVKETIRVMEELSSKGAMIHAHTFLPLPGTPFAKKSLSPLSSELITLINRLTGRGLLFGEWKKQKILTEKINLYLRSGRLS